MSDRDRQSPPTRAALEAVCEVEFVRAGGPGGQHRNKRYTGVRLRHPPTDIVVLATERRSQVRNLDVAFDRMLSRLADHFTVQKPRRPTRPSRGVHRRRLNAKKQRGELKATRRRPEEH